MTIPPGRPLEERPVSLAVLRALHWLLQEGLHIERRFEPFFRRGFNRRFREPLAAFIQRRLDARRVDEGLGLAEERIYPDEDEARQSITASFAGYVRHTYKPGEAERGGNTKTHGIVHAEVTIRDDLPEHMKKGVFAQARTFPAWIRYSGPGPNLPPDIRDVGFMSMAMKLMDVPGPKLMADEQHTQDFITVTTPTFVTPDTRENQKLHIWSFRGLPLYYFLNLYDPHLIDFFMQALWNETQYNPLAAQYWSCTPYLLGEGQAMVFTFVPRSEVETRIPGVPFGRVPPNYLKDNMAKTLGEKDAEFEMMLQVQTDSHAMPVENASVRWPTSRSPWVPAATIRIPRQTFDTPERAALSKTLSMNPWHCIPEHRPLGNQNRARLRMYRHLSRLRQEINNTPHEEPRPVGEEVGDVSVG